jgi:hypothetical protein
LLSNGRGNEPNARNNAPNPQTSVIARAEGPWQSSGFHPRDDVSLPFLPERRMAIPDYRVSPLGLVKKAKCDSPARFKALAAANATKDRHRFTEVSAYIELRTKSFITPRRLDKLKRRVAAGR